MLDEILDATPVYYSYTADAVVAKEMLDSITSPLVGCDFETASKYTLAEKEQLKEDLLVETNYIQRKYIQQKIDSDGLSHPSLAQLTHFSIAWSESDAFVFIIDNEAIRDTILNWIITTDKTQIWHNLSFDGKHILYHTKRLPKNYEDTQILAKTLLNHVDVQQALTGLKHLMAYKYGSWAVSADVFELSQMYEESVLKYAATDACATYSLYQDIITNL